MLLFQDVTAQENTTGHYRPAHIGLTYPISSNGTQAADCENGFSFHALIGVSGAERAFSLAGLGSHIQNDAKGALISGLFNRVGRDAHGLQLAGLMNLVQNQATGVQLAGLFNNAGLAQGVQCAGLLNRSESGADIQVAGLINSSKNSNGLQLAGLINKAVQAMGLQLTGLLNRADTSNTQVAGLMNSSKNLNGLQLAGLINIAGQTKGTQIAGLINIAEESDYPIAPLNLIKNGEKQIGLSLDADGNSMLNFRSGGRRTYGLLGLGYNFVQAEAPYVLEAGIGLHIPIERYFRLNLELSAAGITDFSDMVYHRASTRLLAEVIVAKRIGLFAGPSMNYLGHAHNREEMIEKRYIWNERTGAHYNGLYWGITGGIHVSI